LEPTSAINRQGRAPPRLLDLGGQALGERDGRRVAEVRARERDVAPRVARLARGSGVAAQRERLVERGAELVEHVEQRLRVAGGDVVRGARVAALGGGDRARDDVGDVREVARLAPVAEDRELLAAQRRVDEPRQRHVRPLARAVGGEVAQADDVDALRLPER
jgi:hypothetical protein